jgi:hypothetical protein
MKELEAVALTEDAPEHGLKAGDVGTIVLVHGDEAGYEVEFTTPDGDTLAVVTLASPQMRQAQYQENP